MLGLSLDWQHCPDGVELHDYGPELPRRRGETILSAAERKSGLWFRPRSAKRFPLRHTMTTLEDLLVLRLVNARDDEARAAFLGRFGFPFSTAPEVSREEVLDGQKRLRSALGVAASGERAARLANVNGWLKSIALWPQFGRDGDSSAVRLVFQPASLFAFMAMEAAMAAEHDAKLAACQHCGTEFLTGPMTGRRDTARYCADKCRVAAMRARNA